MLDYTEIEELIKSSKNPLILLIIIITNKEQLLDCELALIIRLFMKNHFTIFIKITKEQMSSFINKLENYIETQNIILDFFVNLEKQVNLMRKIKKFSLCMNPYYQKQKIIKQLEILEKKYMLFKATNDCSIGFLSFHEKIKTLDNDKYNVNTNEMLDRLTYIYKLFGYNFFKCNNISMISYYDFEDFNINKRVRYVEYIFNKVNYIITDIINNIKLYDCIRNNMLSIINPKFISINIDNLNSEIDYNDII